MSNNVPTAGTGPAAIMFAHGSGCDRSMWRHAAPAFDVGAPGEVVATMRYFV